ncbi:MAG: MerC domain-containing protein [Actinomycetota bacterium]|nr:MerC domain-containing protein [Actinomycetota bacterium]
MKSSVFGSLGATVAALCCAGVPAVFLAALSAVGLGFLVNDAILLPLTVLALGVALWGLWRGTARHGLRGILVLGGIGAVLLVVGIFLYPLVYVGVAAMLGAAAWNAVALHRVHG